MYAPLADKLEKGDRIPTTSPDPLDLHPNHRSRTRQPTRVVGREEGVELGSVAWVDRGVAVEAEDAGWAFEGVEYYLSRNG